MTERSDTTADTGVGVEYPPETQSTAQRSGCRLSEYADYKNIPLNFLTSLGLTDFQYMGAPAIRITYRDTAGAEAAIRFRIALEGHDKFRWRKGSHPSLYGLDRLQGAGTTPSIVMVEGESDCHTLWQHGIPALGLPGAANWSEDRDAAHLDGFEIIYVVLEPDQGGEAVQKWVSASKIRDRVKFVRLGAFKDPSALYCDSPNDFHERWQAALDNATAWKEEQEERIEEARQAAWEVCKTLAQKRDILAHFKSELEASGVVGEAKNASILFLAVMSRLFDRPVSVAVKGPSSGGKSFMVERVLSFFPDHAIYKLTGMSEKALAYSEEPLKHRMLVIYESSGMANDYQSYLIRTLLSEGCIAYETVEKTPEGMRSRRIEREGPTGLITTTTAAKLHPENETRLLSLTVSDTPEQTRSILRKQADVSAYVPAHHEEFHALQVWIETGQKCVVIPYVGVLSDLVSPAAVRMRRDFPMLLSLIQAHALLHQANRERDAQGRIVAYLADYAAVYDLVADLVREGVQATVPKRIRETVEVVAALSDTHSEGVPLTTLVKTLGLDKSACSRRVKECVGLGYLNNEEDRKGRPARLKIGEELPDEADVFPKPEVMWERYCSVDSETRG